MIQVIDCSHLRPRAFQGGMFGPSNRRANSRSTTRGPEVGRREEGERAQGDCLCDTTSFGKVGTVGSGRFSPKIFADFIAACHQGFRGDQFRKIIATISCEMSRNIPSVYMINMKTKK